MNAVQLCWNSIWKKRVNDFDQLRRYHARDGRLQPEDGSYRQDEAAFDKPVTALSVILIDAHAIKLSHQFEHIVEELKILLFFIFRQMLLIMRDDPLFRQLSVHDQLVTARLPFCFHAT